MKNSEGWMPKLPNRLSQRFAPLISVPKKNVATTSATATAQIRPHEPPVPHAVRDELPQNRRRTRCRGLRRAAGRRGTTRRSSPPLMAFTDDAEYTMTNPTSKRAMTASRKTSRGPAMLAGMLCPALAFARAMGRPYFPARWARASTSALKARPRSSNEPNSSKEAQAGESSTTSPAAATESAASKASSKCSARRTGRSVSAGRRSTSVSEAVCGAPDSPESPRTRASARDEGLEGEDGVPQTAAASAGPPAGRTAEPKAAAASALCVG